LDSAPGWKVSGSEVWEQVVGLRNRAWKKILQSLCLRMLASRKSPPLREGVRRIAVWQFGGIGDMIIGAAVVRDVLRRYPDANVDVYCSSLCNSEFIRGLGARIGGIYEYNAYALDFRTMLTRKIRNCFSRTADVLRGRQYDLIINLHIPKLADWWLFEILLMRRSGARFLAGFVPQGAPQGLLDRQMETSVAVSRHYLELYRDLLLPIGIEVGNRGYFHVTESQAVSKLAVLHPGASMLFKRWPIESFIALARRLEQRGWRIAVVGDEKEQSLGDAIAKVLPTAENRAGKLNLQQMADLLAGAGLFVGNDSAPFHLAVAVNVNAVGIFGAGPAMYSDYPVPNVRIVRKKLFCAPCFSNVCNYSMECIAELSVQSVWNAVAELIDNTSCQDDEYGAE